MKKYKTAPKFLFFQQTSPLYMSFKVFDDAIKIKNAQINQHSIFQAFGESMAVWAVRVFLHNALK